MGTKEEKLDKYRNLWIQFEKLLKKDGLTLSSFAKKWELKHDDEASDYKRFYNRIKKQKNQLKALRNAPQSSTILQIQEYIKFLDDGYFTQELLEDEKVTSWFN